MSSHDVTISGIQVRNLENVSLHFQRGEIVLFTGLSGSGKTSLAFDTVYALGLQKYLETLPSFFTQAITHLPPPVVQSCIGLSPTVAIRQNYFSYHNHTTLGATTQIFHYLALLLSLEGQMNDPETLEPLDLTSKEYIIAFLLNLPDQTPITLLAPLTKKQPSDIQKYIQEGYTKIYIDGGLSPIYSFLQTGLPQDTSAYILVDHIVKQPTNHARIKVSLTSTLDVGDGSCTILLKDHHRHTFNTRVYNPRTQQTYTPLSLQDFSPHGIFSRCLTCQGSGIFVYLDPSYIHPKQSILEDWSSVYKHTRPPMYRELFQAFAEHSSFDLNTPWEQLPPSIQNAFLYGDGHLVLAFPLFDPFSGKKTISYRAWKGVLNELGEKLRYSSHPQKYLSSGVSAQTCDTCRGSGLKPLAVATTWHGKHYDELQALSIAQLYSFLQEVPESPATKDILQALCFRLSILMDLGLSYLTPHRALASLSSGEQERTALAKHIGAKLTGITYVLDEPSIGLHPQDIEKLMSVILKLRKQGNTVLLIEHEDRMILMADRVIDVGPRAGIYGGKIQFNGTPRQFLAHSDSLTAQYLRQEKHLDIPSKRPPSPASLLIENANVHNLKNISVTIPLGRIIAITGVSGSGKSSLINDFLVPHMHHYLRHEPCNLSFTCGDITHLVHVTRELPGKTQRSIPLTYMKAFDALRQLFANQPDSLRLGLTKAHFSFNLPIGACSECKGLGAVPTELYVYIPCPQCLGQRFQPQVLEVLYHEKNISDILNMTAQEGAQFFQNQPKLYEPIHALCALGLHYLPLGRPLFSLSGGEIQRLKLAFELLYPHPTPTLYVLDEPSTGLHTHDLQVLIHAFAKLIDLGHTVVLIEHNMHLVQIADHIVELGPEGGEHGGYLLASCSMDEFLLKDTSTAKALRQITQATCISPLDPEPIPPPAKAILIEDAYHGTLKHLTLSIPNHALTVVAGPAASGKKTLLFDVLYAYGNILYSEIFPPYLRQTLIQKTSLPKVSAIQGLAPIVAIYNTTRPSQSKYTVASALDIAVSLATLFTTYGIPHDPCTPNIPLIKISPQSLAQYLILHHLNTPVTITIPVHESENLEFILQQYRIKGFLKLFANDHFYDVDDDLPENLQHVAVVVQHMTVSHKNLNDISSALSLAFASSPHVCLLFHEQKQILSRTFSKGWMNSQGHCFPPITKDSVSPYHWKGQCPECLGNGAHDHHLLCSECSGTGLHPRSKHLLIEGVSILKIYKNDLSFLKQFLDSLPSSYTHTSIQDLQAKISFASQVSLDHLLVGQKQHTLSRGELFRLHIAKVLASQLTDIVYIFEDPLSGMHPKDQTMLIRLLKSLVKQSNTVLASDRALHLVPHADHTIYLGPQSGPLGGELVNNLNEVSLPPAPLFTSPSTNVLPIHFTTHYGKHIRVSLPLQTLVIIMGISGAGKTTFLKNGVYAQTTNAIYLDASPLPASKRSDLGSYFDITPSLRSFYASLASSKALNISASMFSPNTKQGQCSECLGVGYRSIDRAFYAMETVPCSSCSGFRLQPLSLEVSYQDKHFGHILQTPIQELLSLFPFLKKIQAPIQALIDIGLGYLPLGQPFSSLSASEKACIKIAKNLCLPPKQPSVFLLDESLVFLDVKQKIFVYKLFAQLIDAGHSIILVDNDISFIKYANLVLEFGPGAGQYGGEIIFAGTPQSYPFTGQ